MSVYANITIGLEEIPSWHITWGGAEVVHIGTKDASIDIVCGSGEDAARMLEVLKSCAKQPKRKRRVQRESA